MIGLKPLRPGFQRLRKERGKNRKEYVSVPLHRDAVAARTVCTRVREAQTHGTVAYQYREEVFGIHSVLEDRPRGRIALFRRRLAGNPDYPAFVRAKPRQRPFGNVGFRVGKPRSRTQLTAKHRYAGRGRIGAERIQRLRRDSFGTRSFRPCLIASGRYGAQVGYVLRRHLPRVDDDLVSGRFAPLNGKCVEFLQNELDKPRLRSVHKRLIKRSQLLNHCAAGG